jgi:signal-induced proliferation-associated 1 like protein 3
MRRDPHGGLDTESLQTDVMRFMAIIGFCLIAILALVRNVEPPPVDEVAATETPVVEEEVEIEIPPPVVVKRPPIAPVVKLPLPPIAPVVKRPAPPITRPLVELKPPPPKIAPTPLPRLIVKKAPPPVEPAEPAKTAVPAVPEVPPSADEPEGLVLRFTSDNDFLNLVSARRVQVYAWTDAHAYRLDAGFALHEAEHPGRVFELLAETIPGAIRANLARLAEDAEGFTWAVSFPPDIEANLTRLRGQHTAGLLLIDRNGGIEHVANS